MAQIYVRSSDGSNADNGSTWALAKATLVGADAIDAAGDQINLSSAHSESTAGVVTVAVAGTLANPTKILSVSDSGSPEPPTTLAAGAAVTTTGVNAMNLSSSIYCYGVTFTCGSNLSLANSAVAHKQLWDTCTFRLTGTAGVIGIGGASSATPYFVEWKNCNARVANFGSSIQIRGHFRWHGGSWEAGGTNPSGVFSWGASNAGSYAEVIGVDFSALGTSVNMVQGTPGGSGVLKIISCKLPGSWTGTPAASVPAGFRVEMHDCDSGDTNYRLWTKDYGGEVSDETTIVRTGGASDGTTSFSWKMVTTANVAYPSSYLESPYMAIWCDDTSSKTLTVEFVHDSVTNLTDKEISLRVFYHGTSGNPKAVLVEDISADYITTAADQTTSAVTWTTTGLTNPNKQKLSVTFTPTKKGWVQACVLLYKVSKTVYIDPIQSGSLV